MPAPVRTAGASATIARAMLDLTGQVLAGRFRVDSSIASGGMGAVYVATDTTIGRRVALKMLHPDLAVDQDNLERMREEAFSLASLRHPNIVQLYDFHRGGPETTFTVMELVEGESLAKALVRQPRLPVEVAVDYAKQTLSALAAAHAQGIVHRDIKPANLMVVPLPARRELIKVLDFGIAKLTEATIRRRPTTSSLMLGTPAFMAPEQTAGGAIDGRTDLHAVGILLYRMLAGENPLAGPDVPTTLQFVNTRVPADIRTHRPDVPEEVARAIARALEKAPALRFSSAEEFAEALGVGHLTSLASRPGSTPARTGPGPSGPVSGTVLGPGPRPAVAISQTDATAEGARWGPAAQPASSAAVEHTGASFPSQASRLEQHTTGARAPAAAKSHALLVGLGVSLVAIVLLALTGTVAWLASRHPEQAAAAPPDAAPPPADASATPTPSTPPAASVAPSTATLRPAPKALTAAAPTAAPAAVPRDDRGKCQCLPLRGNRHHGDNMALAPSPMPTECECESAAGSLCPHAISPVPCQGRPGCDNSCRGRFSVGTLGAPCTGFNSQGLMSSSVFKSCRFPASARTYEGPPGRACKGLTVDGQMLDGKVFCPATAR